MGAEKGKFIVLYGANNLGKSLQTELLVTSLQEKGIPVKQIKYPIYDLEPTGPLINEVLRHGKQMEETDVQKLYVQNRKDYEPQLKKDLDEGTWIVAEDYIGTGIVWGMVRGLSLDFCEEINKDLLKEDLALVFCGERFLSGKESTHRNENDDELWKKAYDLHMQLAEKYGWIKVFANQTPEKVHEEVLKALEEGNLL